MKNKVSTILFITFVSFLFAVYGEFDQGLRGHSFNINQLFDSELHHEHLILICISVTLFLIIILKVKIGERTKVYTPSSKFRRIVNMNKFLVGFCGFSLMGLSLILLDIFRMILIYGEVRIIEPLIGLVLIEMGLMVGCVVLGIVVIRIAFMF